MFLKNTPKKFCYEMNAVKNHAQIVIEISPPANTLQEVERIIRNFGANIIETKYLSTHCVLIKLDIQDMRDIVLKLSENGFYNIQGINALTSGS